MCSLWNCLFVGSSIEVADRGRPIGLERLGGSPIVD
jgi:hypothetical protein